MNFLKNPIWEEDEVFENLGQLHDFRKETGVTFLYCLKCYF